VSAVGPVDSVTTYNSKVSLTPLS